ncbi:EAL domain-containing protein [Aliivibrio salmonicida]|uniref:EAL domain-containing protein n=1 Tax=Aliivibrio salmonicida TaxID=40269 RepID=UPI003D0DAC13
MSRVELALTKLDLLKNKTCTEEFLHSLIKINFDMNSINEIIFIDTITGEACSDLRGNFKVSNVDVKPDLSFNNMSLYFNLNSGTKAKHQITYIKRNNTIVAVDYDNKFWIGEEVRPIIFSEIKNEKPIHTINILDTGAIPLNSDIKSEWTLVKSDSKVWPLRVTIAYNRLDVITKVKEDFIYILFISIILSTFIFLMFTKNENINFKQQVRYGIKNKEFVLFYQPIINMSSRQCEGAEILIRWIKKNGEIIQPNSFIPMMESSGLITELTYYILNEIFNNQYIKENKMYLSINISAEDLLCSKVFNFLVENHKFFIMHHQLCLELTERSFMEEDNVKGNLNILSELGYNIFIDDFGTGGSNISYLHTLPVNKIKIDKMFIDSIDHSSPTSSVTGHITKIAHSLGIEVIAEGVERVSQEKLLKDYGVQSAQGWLFSKAMSEKEWLCWLSKPLIN